MGMDERTARGKPIHRRAQRDYRWEGVERLPYKEDERARFKSVSRQVLFSDPDLAGELRYFEVEPGGFTSLERHEHMHGVLIPRDRGRAARLSVHGQRRPRQAAAADRGGARGAARGAGRGGVFGQRIETDLVGWVERVQRAKPIVGRLLGFAALNPTYSALTP